MLAEPAYLPSSVTPAAAAAGPAFSPLWRIPYRFPASQLTPPQQAPPGVVTALYASQALGAPPTATRATVGSDKTPGDARYPDAKLAVAGVAATPGAAAPLHQPVPDVTYIPSASAMQWASPPIDNDAWKARWAHQHTGTQPLGDATVTPARQTDTLQGPATFAPEAQQLPSGRATPTRSTPNTQPFFHPASTFTTATAPSGASTPAPPTTATPPRQETPTFQGLPAVDASMPEMCAMETPSFTNPGRDVESRYVILPGGMFARPKDVYVESLPGGAGRQTGGCLAMSLHDMLIRYDALDKHYYRLKEENAKLRVALFELYQRVPVTPISRNMVIMECDSDALTDAAKAGLSTPIKEKTAVCNPSRPVAGDSSTEASFPESRSPMSDGDDAPHGRSPSMSTENQAVGNDRPAHPERDMAPAPASHNEPERLTGHRRSSSHASQARHGKPAKTTLPSRMGSDPLLSTSVSSSSSPIQKHNAGSPAFTTFSAQNRKLTSGSPKHQRASDRISRLPSEHGLRSKLLAPRTRRTSVADGSRRLGRP